MEDERHQRSNPQETFRNRQLRGDQIAAITQMKKLGSQLATERGDEIATWTRDIGYFQTFPEMAVKIHPDIEGNQTKISFFARAIQHATELLIPDEERILLSERRRAMQLERIAGSAGSEKRRELARKAALAKVAAGQHPDIRKMTLARGKIPWDSEAERERIVELCSNPQFILPNYGYPDYKTITQVINQEFHAGNPVRVRQAVKENYKVFRRKS